MNSEEMRMPPRSKIFLGGACTSKWRDKFIPALDYYDVNYFNPVVDEWTTESIKIEEFEKAHKCDIHLYYFDNTMTGMYSMAEMMKSCYDTICKRYDPEEDCYYSCKYVKVVVMVVNTNGMSEFQIRSFDASFKLAKEVSSNIYCKLIDDETGLNGDLAQDLKKLCTSIEDCWELEDDDYEDED